ncbi:MAG: MFS transporter [Pseudomonadota bacterium]
MSRTQTRTFGLLRERRFLPFFLTQFFGAFNDNLFRNALILFIALQSTHLSQSDSALLINLSAALFILPYFLFSALGGQLADKYEKSHLIRILKITEFIIAIHISIGYFLGSMTWLISSLFLIGTQSSFFSPIKYSYLPQHLKTNELIAGNGLLEMGTFIAILTGTIAGSILMGIHDFKLWISISIIGLSALGLMSSYYVPNTPALAKNLVINWNFVQETCRIIKTAATDRPIFLCILGISWFWFFGTIFLSQLPQYALYYLGGDEYCIALLLMLFAFSVGMGSISCNRLGHGLIELGLVPLGAMGLTGFTLHFASWFTVPNHTPIALMQLITSPAYWPIFIDTIGIGFFSGLYLVPLYSYIQREGTREFCSRLIAANNIMNAIFMIAASLFAMCTLSFFNWQIPRILFFTGVLTGSISLIIFYFFPEVIFRFLAWAVIHTLYTVEDEDLHQIPTTGPGILICNHVSFMDPILITAVCRRPIRFVMYHSYAKIPVVSFIFRTAKTIPIASKSENPALNQAAYEAIHEALSRGELVGIFPEGEITRTGELAPFKAGILKMLERDPVPVIPMALRGLWGSVFSRKHGGRALSSLPRQWFYKRIGIVAGEVVQPQQVDLDDLHARVLALRGDNR